MRLSTQECNLISIYHSGSRLATAEQIREVFPCMDYADAASARHAIDALETMSDTNFDNFDPDRGDPI